MMDVFVTQLPTCVNREMIDKVIREKRYKLQGNFVLDRLLEILRRI